MDANCTIITEHREIALLLQALSNNTVLTVDPRFLDLDAPGFTEDFEPQLKILNPQTQKRIAALRGKVICALPPKVPGESSLLLYSVLHTLRNSHATVLYAPIHDLQPDNIQQAITNAAPPDAWFITSMVARRLTNRLVGMKVIPAFRKAGINYHGWLPLLYLHWMATLKQPTWTRHLLFGECRADEIDCFGGIITHPKKPGLFQSSFTVQERTIEESIAPDPRFTLNHILQNSTEPLEKYVKSLETAYNQGDCSWPFTYGAVAFGQQPFNLQQPIPNIQLPLSITAKKTLRLYTSPSIMFRSISYQSLDSTQPSINPLPLKNGQIKFERCEIPMQTTFNAFLTKLSSQQLNLDPYAFQKLLDNNIIIKDNQNISITSSGEKILKILADEGLTQRVFYLLLRILENIQTDEASYSTEMHKIAKSLA